MKFNRFKKLAATAVGVVLTAGLVACGGAPQAEKPEAGEGGSSAEFTGVVPVYTPRQGGSAFVLGGGIATLMSKGIEGVQGSVEATTGTQEMVQRLNERFTAGTPAFTVMDSAGASKAFTGETPFDTQFEELRSLSFVQEAVAYIVTRADSDIQTLADLEGKSVGMGVPGSPVNFLTKEVLAAHGIDEGSYKEQPLGYEEVADGLSNGSLDAGVIAGAPPVATLTELTAGHEIRIIPVDTKVINDLNASSPYIYGFESAAGTYNKIDVAVPTFAFSVGVFTHKNVSDELVTEVMQILFEQTADLAAVHPSANGITFENALKGIAVDLHPAAAAYLEANGVELP